jgi:hypothetical protein
MVDWHHNLSVTLEQAYQNYWMNEHGLNHHHLASIHLESKRNWLAHPVTSSWNEASLYASWTRVSSGTGQYVFIWWHHCTTDWWLRSWLMDLEAILMLFDRYSLALLCSVIVSESCVCGLMVAWYDVFVCMILYVFKRSQLGPEAASWISCQYTGIPHSYHSRAP